MGDESQILAAGRGSVKIHHGEFKNVLYVPSLVANVIVFVTSEGIHLCISYIVFDWSLIFLS